MRFVVEFKPRAVKDLEALPPRDRKQVLIGIERLQDSLAGNVKRLANFTPEFRLRVGRYRILFETDKQRVIIYRVLQRKEAYKSRR